MQIHRNETSPERDYTCYMIYFQFSENHSSTTNRTRMVSTTIRQLTPGRAPRGGIGLRPRTGNNRSIWSFAKRLVLELSSRVMVAPEVFSSERTEHLLHPAVSECALNPQYQTLPKRGRRDRAPAQRAWCSLPVCPRCGTLPHPCCT